MDTGRLGEAETLMRRSIAVAEKLLAEFPEVMAHRKALARACGNLGIVESRGSNWKAAIASIEKGLGLVGEHDQSAEARFALAKAQWHVGDKERARKAFEQAVRSMDKYEPFNGKLRRLRDEAAELLKVKSGDASRK